MKFISEPCQIQLQHIRDEKLICLSFNISQYSFDSALGHQYFFSISHLYVPSLTFISDEMGLSSSLCLIILDSYLLLSYLGNIQND